MSEPSTFELAKKAADDLFKESIKPSVNKIREKLNGKGGQKTIQDALDEWWFELQEKLNHYEQREDVPEHLFILTDQLWDVALSYSSAKQVEEQERFVIQITEINDKLRLAEENLQQTTEALLLAQEDKQKAEHAQEDFKKQLAVLKKDNQQLKSKEEKHAEAFFKLRSEVELSIQSIKHQEELLKEKEKLIVQLTLNQKKTSY